jgi:transcriptional regulator with XRE-family HTH domain
MSDHAATQTGIDPLALGVGRAIKEARQRVEISMRTLATRCGVSQPFLSEVERGMATPSIATLYKVADALGVEPSSLLPTGDTGDVLVVRADEGRRVPSSERPNSAEGRVVFADDTRGLEVYEYIAGVDDDLDVWFRHEGEKVLHVIAGHLCVDFDQPGESARDLGPGDTLIHTGAIPHRWTVQGPEPVHLFLVVTRVRPRD